MRKKKCRKYQRLLLLTVSLSTSNNVSFVITLNYYTLLAIHLSIFCNKGKKTCVLLIAMPFKIIHMTSDLWSQIILSQFFTHCKIIHQCHVFMNGKISNFPFFNFSTKLVLSILVSVISSNSNFTRILPWFSLLIHT